MLRALGGDGQIIRRTLRASRRRARRGQGPIGRRAQQRPRREQRPRRGRRQARHERRAQHVATSAGCPPLAGYVHGSVPTCASGAAGLPCATPWPPGLRNQTVRAATHEKLTQLGILERRRQHRRLRRPHVPRPRAWRPQRSRPPSGCASTAPAATRPRPCTSPSPRTSRRTSRSTCAGAARADARSRANAQQGHMSQSASDPQPA